MLQRLSFALVTMLVLAACSRSEKVSETPADSTGQHHDDHAAVLSDYSYNRPSTYEGQFQQELDAAANDTVSREGLLALSETLILNEKRNVLISSGDYAELKLVMFRENAPLLRLTGCQNITFSNINFNSQYAYQALVELTNCSDITFSDCTFMFDQTQAIVEQGNTNVIFNNCTFGELPFSNAEEPTLEDQSDESPDDTNEGDESGEQAEETYAEESNESESTEGNNNEYVSAEQPTYPSEGWSSRITSLSIARQPQNLNYFSTNPFFTARNINVMNVASYSVLEFGRDFFTPTDWTKETDTWKDGSEVDQYMPTDCDDSARILSLTRTRRKLWYIHRKLSFEQESGVDPNDRWRDDTWYQNRSYYYYLFTNRSSTFIEGIWREAMPYLTGEVTISKQEYDDALLFVDELLLYYSKVKATPYWEDRFYFLNNMEVNLSSGDYFYQAGFPLHNNVCMRNGYTGGNYVTGYDWGNEAWMYGFWLRRHKEGNMEVVKDILLWAKADITERS